MGLLVVFLRFLFGGGGVFFGGVDGDLPGKSRCLTAVFMASGVLGGCAFAWGAGVGVCQRRHILVKRKTKDTILHVFVAQGKLVLVIKSTKLSCQG